MSLTLDSIKTREELNKILKFLDEQGFGYISDYDLHRKKIESIINNSNKFSINVENNFRENLLKLSNYEIAKDQSQKHFSSFGADHKIMELLSDFYIISDFFIRTPYQRASEKDIIDWYEFKKKFNVTFEETEDLGSGNNVTVHNLDKNYIKINWSDHSRWKFENLYELIFNETPNKFVEKNYGEWQDLGKIEIKIFQKGTASIKGDLTKIKQYYYNSLIKKLYYNNIIIFNKKREFYLKKDL